MVASTGCLAGRGCLSVGRCGACNVVAIYACLLLRAPLTHLHPRVCLLAARPTHPPMHPSNALPRYPRCLHTQVDSASTPEQLGRLLDDVKEAGAKRVLLVFGCPGTTSKEQRAAMMQVRWWVGGLVCWCVGLLGVWAAGRDVPRGAHGASPHAQRRLGPLPSSAFQAKPHQAAPRLLHRWRRTTRRPLGTGTSSKISSVHLTLVRPPTCHAIPPQVAHYKADALYVTNDSPGVEWPNDIITDMVGAPLAPGLAGGWLRPAFHCVAWEWTVLSSGFIFIFICDVGRRAPWGATAARLPARSSAHTPCHLAFPSAIERRPLACLMRW